MDLSASIFSGRELVTSFTERNVDWSSAMANIPFGNIQNILFCADFNTTKLEDQWWTGNHSTTGELGAFPANYTKEEEQATGPEDVAETNDDGTTDLTEQTNETFVTLSTPHLLAIQKVLHVRACTKCNDTHR